MKIHLVNPSDVSFGVAVITPRWLYVIAGATPAQYGDPHIVDETIDAMDWDRLGPRDVVGIGIHTGNAYRGYQLGCEARRRGAFVIFGGIHATLYPAEAKMRGGAHAVVKGDGENVWASVLEDCVRGTPCEVYEGGRVPGASFVSARWNLLPPDGYMWASVQTLRGCPKHCSFCSVWRTDGQEPRARTPVEVVDEIRELRRHGFRFVLLADDNFYPVTYGDVAAAARRADPATGRALERIRQQRFELMKLMAELPDDMVFYTQITMEAAEDPEFLRAMAAAHIRGALVGVESVTAAGLKSVYKDFNLAGDALVTRLQSFRDSGVHVLASFIFGLPTDTAETFVTTTTLAQAANVAFAQFVLLTPFPGTIDFQKWEDEFAGAPPHVDGIPVTRYWLLPPQQRPKVYVSHPVLSSEEVRDLTQRAWDRFYSLREVWHRSKCVESLKARLAFVLISKLYRQMYANTGMATDSARRSRATRMARWIARPCRRLFVASPG
jgi:hypothetical protein